MDIKRNGREATQSHQDRASKFYTEVSGGKIREVFNSCLAISLYSEFWPF